MDLVLILVWKTYNFPFYYINTDRTLRDYGCKPDNCIITDFDGDDVSKFDAVFFDLVYAYQPIYDTLPQRYPHQKFIALSTDPYYYYRFEDSRYDAFFNWTATYRLDSDIPYPFIAIKDKKGNIVGPKIDMHWENDMSNNLNKDLISRLEGKTKAAAWFVKNCNAPSKRTEYIHELDSALSRYGFGVDIYGLCGNLRCPKAGDIRQESYLECDRMLGTTYYFYLAFENNFSEDYVTEKVLRAVNNDVVPVVYGGANYSRFLPPESYLDARQHTPEELSFIIRELIYNPDMYRRFFRWKSHYSYHDAMQTVNICSICAVLNNKTKFETTSVYYNISGWLDR